MAGTKHSSRKKEYLQAVVVEIREDMSAVIRGLNVCVEVGGRCVGDEDE